MSAQLRAAIGLFLFVAAIAFGAAAAWDEQDHRYAQKIATLKLAYEKDMRAISDKAAEAADNAARQEAEWSRKLSDSDQRNTQQLAAKNEELARLRSAVDTASMQLRIQATCPATAGSDVPGAAGAASLDNGTSVELAPSARRSYFDLKAGIQSDQAKLRALQDYVRVILAKPGPATLPVQKPQE